MDPRVYCTCYPSTTCTSIPPLPNLPPSLPDCLPRGPSSANEEVLIEQLVNTGHKPCRGGREGEVGEGGRERRKREKRGKKRNWEVDGHSW